MLRGVYPEQSEGLSMTGLSLSVDEELSSAFEPCLKIIIAPSRIMNELNGGIANFGHHFPRLNLSQTWALKPKIERGRFILSSWNTL
jgi:hypothetical protein